MGKTRLAAQFARRLRERGYPVLSAGALATEGHLPFALAAQLLREPGGAGAKAGPERREADPAPETRPPPAGEPMDRLLARLAKRVGSRPALMVADDLERADRGSLAFLHRALTTRPQGLLLVGTCRPYELQPDSPLAELVQELGKEGRLEEIVLHPLPREDVEDWLAEALPAADPEDLSDLLTLSEGVPWLLHELLANLPGWAYSHAGRRLPLGSVPPAVRAAVRRRIAWLTPEGRRVLQMASLLGQGWSHVPLGALWDGGREELVGGLEACLESGLVVEEGWRSGRYRFSRELYRRAVEAEISTARYGLWRERLRLGLNRPAEARGRLPRTLGRFSL